MKKVFIFVIAIIVLCFSGCGTDFSVRKNVGDSEIFSKEDIEEAMDIVCEVIKKSEGYVLLELKYEEDFCKKQMKYYKERYGTDEVIVLRSKFFVLKETEGALEKGEIAKWSWILVRNMGEEWELKDAGYP
ncbi:MAG: hypothetical protein IKK14_02405 [Oscillospiraceae bacterium]|nr:hypothetical protein [Oscillospiraceae bacterium]